MVSYIYHIWSHSYMTWHSRHIELEARHKSSNADQPFQVGLLIILQSSSLAIWAMDEEDVVGHAHESSIIADISRFSWAIPQAPISTSQDFGHMDLQEGLSSCYVVVHVCHYKEV